MASYSTVRLTADYTHFKIQLGECWSGEEAGETYNRAGTSDKCVTKDYAKCNPSDNQECVGDQNVNFVYGIDVKGNYSLYLAFRLHIPVYALLKCSYSYSYKRT